MTTIDQINQVFQFQINYVPRVWKFGGRSYSRHRFWSISNLIEQVAALGAGENIYAYKIENVHGHEGQEKLNKKLPWRYTNLDGPLGKGILEHQGYYMVDYTEPSMLQKLLSIVKTKEYWEVFTPSKQSQEVFAAMCQAESLQEIIKIAKKQTACVFNFFTLFQSSDSPEIKDFYTKVAALEKNEKRTESIDRFYNHVEAESMNWLTGGLSARKKYLNGYVFRVKRSTVAAQNRPKRLSWCVDDLKCDQKAVISDGRNRDADIS